MSQSPEPAEVPIAVGEFDVLAAGSDAIRVVPLALPDELAAAPMAAPKLTYRGGHLLSSVEVFTTFWGSAWEQGEPAQARAKIDEFFQFILTSALIDQLAEYSVPRHKIGHGQLVGTAVVPAMNFQSAISDGEIRHRLQHRILTDHRFPPPNRNMLYFIYLPPGVAVVQGGGRSCQVFCGYHDAINGKIFYAVMPWPGCGGCIGGLGRIDALTSTSSHELCEAITDPVPPLGWYDNAHGEIGDICAWKTKQLGSYTVQLEWSNSAGKCV